MRLVIAAHKERFSCEPPMSRFDILCGVKPANQILTEDYTSAVEKAVMFVNRLKSSLLSVRRWVIPWMFIAAT
jgi:hypothetical protein